MVCLHVCKSIIVHLLCAGSLTGPLPDALLYLVGFTQQIFVSVFLSDIASFFKQKCYLLP